ncbi:hypothetical protein EPO44_10200 [bacterium]|nr:MAG: hypothetical protein EPO44_10200 [bacterium]
MVSYQVQEGYAAVLVGLVNLYSGTGYTQGTATLLTWKLRLDQTEDVQFYENILMDHGNLATPWPVPGGIRLKSGQLLELRVTVPVGSTIGVGGTNRNIGVLMGWEWPAAAGEDF